MPKELDITINVDAMRLGDLEVLENVTNMAPGSVGNFFEMLDRVASINGVDNVRELPLTAMSEIASAITDAVNAVTEEGN